MSLASVSTQSEPALSTEERLKIYRTMLLSRRLDDLEIHLKRQNHLFFQISGAGHEATLAAASMAMKPGHDWFFPYYRDRALCLGLGVSAYELLLQGVGAAEDPSSGGRHMPAHWGHKASNIVSQSSPTGTQFLNAVGCAEAGVAFGRMSPTPIAKTSFQKDEVVYVSSGEGATSEGEFFEALNTACNLKLPVVFHIEDNGYAISVPVEVQTAGGSISALVDRYPNLMVRRFNGCDPEESYQNWTDGVAYARARKGPVLLHADVVRPYSHSMSDDERAYRTEDERTKQAERDPISSYRKRLAEEFGCSEKDLAAIDKAVEAELDDAKERALAAPSAEGSTATDFVFSPDVDPTSSDFETRAKEDGDDKTMVDLINACMRDEMRRDSRIVVFGEDVADVSREEALPDLKGKGGVFKVTHGLQREFGGDRVFNSPLAEANIVGRAVGMALRGLKPVVEIQFFDYIWPAMMQIRSELALLRWRSNNDFDCPAVIRTTYGGYLRGGGIYHSQTGETLFTHIPGLRVVLPSNALDANGLLRTAIRCEDPVIFLEHKHLYRQTYNRAPYPGDDFMIPLGKARIVKPGKDLTIVTCGALVKRTMDAVQKVRDSIDVEVIDLRTLAPYDWETIAESVRKTGKVIVAHEDSLSWGYGSEISARIAEELFDDLDGPVRRVASLDTFVGYHPNLEEEILPQVADVERAIRELAAY